MPGLITIGISDCQWSDDPANTLVTYALGSCIAVAIYDPEVRAAGLLHFMLPDSSIGAERGRTNPFMYADTGIPLMVEKLLAAGAARQRLVVRVAGGAQVLDDQGFFNIGKRNHASMRKAIWKAGMFVHGEAVGGTQSRTMWLEVGSGRCLIREGSQPPQELGPLALGKGR